MSRDSVFFVLLLIAAAMYYVVFWVGTNFGFTFGCLTLFALIPVNLWMFEKLPKPPARTKAEKRADELAWTNFFEVLFFRIGPVVFVGWIFYRLVNKL